MFAPTARAPRARVLTRLHGAGLRLAASARRRWFLDRDAQFWMAELGSAWSVAELRARVVDILDETAEARTFVLAPNRHWPGHRAGQYVPVSVEIEGVRTTRCYSISSGGSRPGAGVHIAITVARGGRVSSWMHDRLRPGSFVELGAPAGDFVLPATDAPLLFVAGGSGITPIAAMLRDLGPRDVVLVHSARDAASAIFGRELAAMPHRIVAHHSRARGRLDAAGLAALVPDLARREIFACGPAGLLDAVAEAAAQAGVADRVHVERFTPAITKQVSTAAVTVQLRGGRTVALDGAGSLLEQLERAGERPAYGCRMGICNTCRCTKVRGTVLDLGTGRISDAPGEAIRPCVSIPHSDLELDR
jgi:ferredoxin-NADP reductase